MFSVYKSYTLALYKKQIRSAVCFLCKAVANYYTIAQVRGSIGLSDWIMHPTVVAPPRMQHWDVPTEGREGHLCNMF